MSDNKLTNEKIHAAADALVEAGTRPTLANVRDHLGGGSFTTISAALKSWKAKEAEEHELAQVVVPDAVSERLDLLKADLWKVAQTEAERRLQADRAALKEAQEAAELEVAEATEAVRTLEAEAIQCGEQITDLTGQVEELTAQVEELTAQLHQRQSECASLKAHLEDATAATAKAEAQIEKLRSDLDAQKDKNAELQRQNDGLVRNLKDAEKARQELELDLHDATQQLEISHAASEHKYDKLNAELKAAQAEKADLEKALAEAEKTATAEKADLEKALAEAEKTATAEKADLEKRIAVLEAEKGASEELKSLIEQLTPKGKR